MGSLVGNKRHRNEHTFDVKYAALMEIDWGLSMKDVSKKLNFPKKHHVHVENEQWKIIQQKIIATFNSSGWTIKQLTKEGTCEQVNLAVTNGS